MSHRVQISLSDAHYERPDGAVVRNARADSCGAWTDRSDNDHVEHSDPT